MSKTHSSFSTSIKAAVESARASALPGSTLGQSLQYALGQWPKLIRLLNHPELELSTNLAENSVRPIAVGRKNWIHLGGPQAGPRWRPFFRPSKPVDGSSYPCANIYPPCYGRGQSPTTATIRPNTHGLGGPALTVTLVSVGTVDHGFRLTKLLRITIRNFSGYAIAILLATPAWDQLAWHAAPAQSKPARPRRAKL